MKKSNSVKEDEMQRRHALEKKRLPKNPQVRGQDARTDVQTELTAQYRRLARGWQG